MKANYDMLDTIGIIQHHDAVTGTAKQRVADDYNKRVHDALTVNDVVYGDLIADKVAQDTGLSSPDQWLTCERTNATYKACPITNYASDYNTTMTVAVHNPSSIDMNEVSILVPHGYFAVSKFVNNGFESIKSSVACHEDTYENGKPVDNCRLLAAVKVPANGFAYLQVIHTEEGVTAPKIIPVETGSTMQRGLFSVEFLNYDRAEATIRFLVRNQGIQEVLEFSTRYWASYVEDNGLHQFNSGAYDFRPIRGQYDPYPYGQYNHGEVSLDADNNVIEWNFFFEKDAYGNKHGQKSIVTVSIDPDLDVVKFDVDFDSLPFEAPYDGFEVVAHFKVNDMPTNRTFWTDSNGLEMQKRVLDYRPSWDFYYGDLSYSNENVTANYYPINSAIYVEGRGLRFTVMNDRAQGGSSLRDGTIELMQNREIPADDNKGVGEWLQEKDQYGNGMRVKATYYVQIERADGAQLQRSVQQRTADPAKYFFNFNATKGAKTEMADAAFDFGAALKACGVHDDAKVVAIPMGWNKLQLRVENLMDEDTRHFNVTGLFEAYWRAGNQVTGAKFDSMDIQEMSLTGNMLLTEMENRRIHWKTTNNVEGKYEMGVREAASDLNNVPVAQQQMRLFEATYTPQKEAFLQ